MSDDPLVRELVRLRLDLAQERARHDATRRERDELRALLDEPARRRAEAERAKQNRASKRAAVSREDMTQRAITFIQRRAVRRLRLIALDLAKRARRLEDHNERTRVIALSQDLLRSATRVRGRLPALFARRQ